MRRSAPRRAGACSMPRRDRMSPSRLPRFRGARRWRCSFGADLINGSSNIIRLPDKMHWNINGYYSSKLSWTNGLTVRDWLKDQSFDDQHRRGIDVITRYLYG